MHTQVSYLKYFDCACPVSLLPKICVACMEGFKAFYFAVEMYSDTLFWHKFWSSESKYSVLVGPVEKWTSTVIILHNAHFIKENFVHFYSNGTPF